LIGAMDAMTALRDINDQLQAYASFNRAINTENRKVYEAQQKLDAEVSSRISFFRVELKSLTLEKLAAFLKDEPNLKKFEFFLADIARFAPHTLSEDKESILSSMSPDLCQWQGDLFQKLFDRQPFLKLSVDGKKLDIHQDFDGLMRVEDRSVREKTFKHYYGFFKKNADLLAFGLRQEMKTLNAIAKLRGFETYYHQNLFQIYLSRPEIDNVYGQLEGNVGLYHEYQTFRMAMLEKDHGIKDPAVWDIEIPPTGGKALRLTAGQGCDLLNQAISVLGKEYAAALKRLLDPKTGRIDLAGPTKREQGAFCSGWYGFFMDNFQGYVGDVSTIAHEAGHAIEYQLIQDKMGSIIYECGPNYMTESFAMFNEWLMRDHLLKTEKDPAILKGLRWDVVNEAMYLWELARRAKFEMVAYDRVAADEITNEKGFNKACTDVGRVYDLYFQKHPELDYHWIRKHHYWTVPGYYVNYVIAHMLALKYYSMYKADPTGFPPKYVAMVSSCFDRPAADLLKDFLGIELKDPALLAGVMGLIREQFNALLAEK